MTASDEAKKALEGVTPGPWWHYIDGFAGSSIKANCNTDDDAPDSSVVLARIQKHYAITFQQEKANARFIAWAREGVPALLAEIAADEKKRADDAEAKLAKAVEALDRIASITVHSGGEIHGVTAQHWRTAFEVAQDEATITLAEIKGDTHE